MDMDLFQLGVVKNWIKKNGGGSGTGGGVQSVNGQKPDENGNVELDFGGVKTVNGAAPDENGNVEIEAGPSDWNTMLNKPFGEEKEVVTLLPKQTLTFAAEPLVGGAPAAVIEAFSVTAGLNYTVTWNGTEYRCVAFDTEFEGIAAVEFGNAGLLGGEDTGEPFYVLTADIAGVCAIVTSAEGNYEVSIAGEVVEIKQIDEKYIPSTLCFDLYEMGLPTVGGTEVSLECDTTEIRDVLAKGVVCFKVHTEYYLVNGNGFAAFTVLLNPVKLLGVFSGCVYLNPYTVLYIQVNNTAIKAQVFKTSVTTE